MSRSMKLLLGLPVLVALFLFAAMVATDPGDNVHLIDSGSSIAPSGTRFVTGTLKNLTGGTYHRVRIEIDFLDEAGEVVGSTTTDRGGLSSGETWTFEVPVLSSEAVEARLQNLTCSKTGEEPDPRVCHVPRTLVRLVD